MMITVCNNDYKKKKSCKYLDTIPKYKCIF